jgi:hypothetical protein
MRQVVANAIRFLESLTDILDLTRF